MTLPRLYGGGDGGVGQTPLVASTVSPAVGQVNDAEAASAPGPSRQHATSTMAAFIVMV